MQRVGVTVHPTRPVEEALDVLRAWTAEHRVELVQVPAGEQPPVAPAGSVSACDVVVALGGDGTVLEALHVASRTRTPVLGVAYGSLGALAAVPHERLAEGLDRFAAGDWIAGRLPALGLCDGVPEPVWAINDLAFVRRGGTQLVLDVFVADELYVRLAGDGIVVATALGSSAYSMAAGGPLLAAGTNAFICTPLAMHGGCAPPIVVPDDRRVTLEAHPGHDGFEVELDGFHVEPDGERFVIALERDHATLVRFEEVASGIARLRERELITDSPRVLARDGRPLAARDR